MRKKELLTRIAHKTGKKRDDVRIIVEELIAEMKETMISGENIYIRGFGSFVTKNVQVKLPETLRPTVDL